MQTDINSTNMALLPLDALRVNPAPVDSFGKVPIYPYLNATSSMAETLLIKRRISDRKLTVSGISKTSLLIYIDICSRIENERHCQGLAA